MRRCCKAACSEPAVATLTYAYADSTAVVGPLAAYAEPHGYDLCSLHAGRLTAPRGWEVVRLPVEPLASDVTGTVLISAPSRTAVVRISYLVPPWRTTVSRDARIAGGSTASISVPTASGRLAVVVTPLSGGPIYVARLLRESGLHGPLMSLLVLVPPLSSATSPAVVSDETVAY